MRDIFVRVYDMGEYMFVYMICHIDTLSVPRGWWRGRIPTTDFDVGPSFE